MKTQSGDNSRYVLDSTAFLTPINPQKTGGLEMNVKVIFPEELLLALREDPESFRKKVFIFTLGKLYEAGRISGGLGAKVLGCDRWDFYRLLSDNGFAVLDYPDEELDQEGEVGSEWHRRIQDQ